MRIERERERRDLKRKRWIERERRVMREETAGREERRRMIVIIIIISVINELS